MFSTFFEFAFSRRPGTGLQSRYFAPVQHAEIIKFVDDSERTETVIFFF